MHYPGTGKTLKHLADKILSRGETREKALSSLVGTLRGKEACTLPERDESFVNVTKAISSCMDFNWMEPLLLHMRELRRVKSPHQESIDVREVLHDAVKLRTKSEQESKHLLQKYDNCHTLLVPFKYAVFKLPRMATERQHSYCNAKLKTTP